MSKSVVSTVCILTSQNQNFFKHTSFTLVVFTQCLTSGPLAEVHMPVDRETRRMKGFATVTFVMPEQAVAAYSKLDGTVFHGRMLHLLPAKTRHSPEGQCRSGFNISLGLFLVSKLYNILSTMLLTADCNCCLQNLRH